MQKSIKSYISYVTAVVAKRYKKTNLIVNRPKWQKKEGNTVSPKGPKVYNKLVRDRIPEIIERAGKRCGCETLPQDQYIAMLDAKLNEELAEYQQSKSLEELEKELTD